MVLSDKNQYQNTLCKIDEICEHLLEVDDDTRIQALTSCQEAAINLGTILEKIEGASDQNSIKELNIIGVLELFCERVYQCSTDPSYERVDEMRGAISEVIDALNLIPRTYRVMFLPYNASMWDSLESIWKCFSEDERCETVVMPIPYFEANQKLQKWEPRYDGDIFPGYVSVVNYQEYLLEEKKPDLVFVHNPFDQYNYVTMVHPAFYSDEIKKHCGKLIYVPYFVNPGFVSEIINSLPLLSRADYLVLQSESMKETCKGFDYYDRVLPLGSPKFDKIIQLVKENVAPPIEWGEEVEGKIKLLLNTTIDDFLGNDEKLILKLQLFFEVVARNENLCIIWRPHPLLKATIKAMRPQLIDKYQELVDYFNDNLIGVLDNTMDVSRAIAVSDAYIGSPYSSIIALFEVINKPVFKFDSNNIYYIDRVQNRKRVAPEKAFEMKVGYFGAFESEDYMFEDFVEDLLNNRLSEVSKMQREAEAGISNNLDGTCGEKVYEYLMGVLQND